MDQTIVGGAGVASDETMGSPDTSGIIQALIMGSTGISSEEAFPRPSGVWTSPEGMPFGRYLAY